ncbi:MAG: redox-regulated ATPase YchF [Planctomycetaceae bacterium]|nr:redox-regulated ATPase YchF [Planctomycetaceae bacterium]
MKIGLVGYQGCGKSTLFEFLTGVEPDLSLSHTTQSAMATIPDERVESLCSIYSPKKITRASLEIVDTPGLSRSHEGNAARLGQIREASCLVQVVGAFDGSDFSKDLMGFEEDLVLTDLEIVANRVERLKDSLRKPRPNRDEQQAELEAIEPILARLEAGEPLSDFEFTDEQLKVTRSFQLLSQKRRLAIINVADDEVDLQKYNEHASENRPVVAVPVGLEVELSRMEAEERDEFRQEMGIAGFDRDSLIRNIMAQSGQMLFFTAGEKEVRTWLIPQGATAVEAADSIHSDLARGFIRAETMSCDDLLRLGSEREVKAENLMRQEPKDYVVQDGDIINVRFSV